MTKRIDKLTPEQSAQMIPFAQTWIKRGLRTTPLTDAEWRVWEEGARKCYEFAGIPFPAHNIIRVSSPLVGAFAAPIAAWWITELRRRGTVGDSVGGSVLGSVRDSVLGSVRDSVRDSVGDSVLGSVGGSVLGSVRDSVLGSVRDSVLGSVGDSVLGSVGDSVLGSVRDSVGDSVGDSVLGSVRDSVLGSVRDSVRGSVGDSVGDSVLGSVGGSVGGSVLGSVRGSVRDSVRDSVRGSVRDSVGDSVGDSVRDSDWSDLRRFIANNWHRFFGGRIGGYYYSDIAWEAYVAYFRDIAGLELDGNLWDRSLALENADSAGWWWPYRDFVMVCDTPVEIHQEQIAPMGWGSHRLHCATGPAVSWADGWGVYAWHGTRVPTWVIENPTVEQAMQEPNSEIRRAAFESIGWDKAIKQMNLTPIGTCADPGNAPHELTLYSLPEQIYDEPVNLLLMVNGSPDRNGNLRMYGETVPASIKDPLSAAAWQYGVSTDVYVQLARRS